MLNWRITLAEKSTEKQTNKRIKIIYKPNKMLIIIMVK
jgi:hypothetical protein